MSFTHKCKDSGTFHSVFCSVVAKEHLFQEWQQIIYTHKLCVTFKQVNAVPHPVCESVSVNVCVWETERTAEMGWETVPVDDNRVWGCLITVPAALLVTAPATRTEDSRRRSQSQGTYSALHGSSNLRCLNRSVIAYYVSSCKLIESIWSKPTGKVCCTLTARIKKDFYDMESECKTGSKRHNLRAEFTRNGSRPLTAPWIAHHLQPLSAPSPGLVHKRYRAKDTTAQTRT